MLDFIKDLLGINRYHVVWKGEGYYAHVRGSTREYGIAPLTKRKARALMHRFSTPGECWFERA